MATPAAAGRAGRGRRPPSHPGRRRRRRSARPRRRWPRKTRPVPAPGTKKNNTQTLSPTEINGTKTSDDPTFSRRRSACDVSTTERTPKPCCTLVKLTLGKKKEQKSNKKKERRCISIGSITKCWPVVDFCFFFSSIKQTWTGFLWVCRATWPPQPQPRLPPFRRSSRRFRPGWSTPFALAGPRAKTTRPNRAGSRSRVARPWAT